MKLQGVFLPIITPFINDKIDFNSYKRMIDYYIGKGITGLIPLGTTGESPTVDEREFEELVAKTVEYTENRVPVFIGVGGNYTKKVIEKVKVVEKYNIDGILSVCPYYNRPDQRGIFEHFSGIAKSTDLNIIIYNIPYRTGRNIENETIYKLSELKNVIGLKDSSGDIKQTMKLLLNPPRDFSIFTGEDMLFYTTMLLGGDGGILASAHIRTEDFMKVYNNIRSNNHIAALDTWNELEAFIPLFFEEPNPAPLKYLLHKMGLINSPELRLPLVNITEGLEKKLNMFV